MGPWGTLSAHRVVPLPSHRMGGMLLVLAAHLGTLYSGAQLDSGLRHMDVVTAAGLDILAAPWLWAIAVFPLAAPALVVLVLVEWTGVAQGGGG